MKIHLIYNPVSGKKNNDTMIQQIVNCAVKNDVELSVYKSLSPHDIGKFTKKITSCSKPVNLMIMGGDGSAHDVLNSIVNFEMTNLYILPGGSGNDFCRELGWNGKDNVIEVFKKYIKDAKIKKVDYFLLNDKIKCLNEISFGMSADILYCRGKMKHFSPQTQYTIATFKKGLFYTNYKFKITFDKQSYDIVTPFLSFGNGQYSGGGIKTVPGAQIDDGFVTISYIRKFPRICILPILIKFKKGSIASCRFHVSKQAKEIDVKIVGIKDGGVYSSDGVLYEHQTEANIKVIPGQLNVAVLNK